ncbi:MAG: Ig-like domain-containing protein, partial [Woeseiaceae bacterium]
MKRVSVLLATALAVFVTSAGAQDISDDNLDAENEAQRNKILALLGSHNLSWGVAWSPDPFVGFAAGTAAYNLNIGLKLTRPVLQEPPDKAVLPTSGDGCSYTLGYSHNIDEVYTDYLGLGPAFNPGAPRLDASWGELGELTVFHGNSDVRVRTTLNGEPFGLPGSSSGAGEVILPLGRHSVGYAGTTQISNLLDVPPWYALSMFLPVDIARKSLGRELLEAAIVGGVLNYGPSAINALAGAGGIGSIQPEDTNAINARHQRFWVLDTVHPQLTVMEPEIQLEAINVGGRVLTPALEAQVRESTLAYSDRCRDRDDLVVQLRAPAFLPVGQDVEVTWRLRDPGPSSLNPAATDPDFPDVGIDDQRNEVRRTQVWRIRDTLPPIIEPPVGRVHESDMTEESVALGKPAVFDLADPESVVVPFIDGEAVETETVNLPSPSRTEVVWRASDRSANSSEKSQWITLKPIGSNTAPLALAQPVSAVSYEELQIELFGQDGDLIDGRYDQLAFRITQPPANGEFIAPLFPFFIEDYRIEANLPEEIQEQGDTDGDGLINPLELIEVFKDWCEDPVRRAEPLPRDLVRNPEYIAVTDDGTTFVRDQVTACNQSDPDLRPRIAQFDADQNLVAEIELPSDFNNVRSFWIANDGFIYFKDPAQIDSIVKVDPTPVPDDPAKPPRMLSSRLLLRPPPDQNGVRSLRDIRSVAVDHNDLLYITDGAAAYVFDMTRRQSENSPESILFVGDLVPRGSLGPDASVNDLMDTTIDSAGNVFFADEELHRVWKFSASTLDRDTDDFIAGELVGWMGRCAGNLTTEPACDTINQRSFGFACTDTLCAVDTSARNVNAERAACGLPAGSGENTKRGGCEAGQFDRPRGIAINGNDILYVADFDNFRIQRFNTDGMFGGEAISSCDGTCFVLGDFGKPVDVSVNKTHFYVLDTEFDLLHVFETTPITNVEDANLNFVQNAFVTYRSNNNFRGVDTFDFATSDGLAESAPVTLSIDVARNFRPPEAIPQKISTPEDTGIDITLLGADPDEDTLTYTVVREPGHGVLEGTAPDVRYIPGENFEGTDSFAFVVDDRITSMPALTSEPAEVVIEVLPAPDDPTLSIEFAERTGVAYDTPISIYSFDPDVGDEFSITIEWGDGTNPQAATTDTQAIGIWPVLYTDRSFEARVEGEHRYSSPGQYTLRVCVADDVGGASLSSCDDIAAKTVLTRTVLVEELIELVVHTSDDQPKVEEPQCPPEAAAEGTCPMRSIPLVDGDTITYTATIGHLQLGDSTRPATGISAVLEFPQELAPLSVQIDAGTAVTSGTITGRRVDVSISELAVEEQAFVSVT